MKTKTFEDFLQDKFMELREIGGMPITKDNCEDMFDNWSQQLDVQELIDYGQEYGDTRDMPDYGDLEIEFRKKKLEGSIIPDEVFEIMRNLEDNQKKQNDTKN